MCIFGPSDDSIFNTLEHEKHRMRQEPWNSYFSKQSVSRLQPLLIQPLVDKLCNRLSEYKADGRPVKLISAFANLPSDIIFKYGFFKALVILTIQTSMVGTMRP